MKQKIIEHRLSWHVDSAGTSGWHVGELPDPRAIAIALKYGIDITYQRARQFSPRDFQRFDIIYAMDMSNYQDILRYASSETERRKVRLILNEVYPGENRSVPDPYYDDEGFEAVFQLLESACFKIVERYTQSPLR